MSIIDNIRIKQDWDPTGEKGGYKIDYAYQEPEEPARQAAAAELSDSDKLDIFDGLIQPRTLKELRANISKVLNTKILVPNEVITAINRAIGSKKLDGITRQEGESVWASIDDMVEDKYKDVAFRPPNVLPDPYAGIGQKNFLPIWQEELLKEL